MSFPEEEIAYLRFQGTGRLATVDPDGQPNVVPVAVEFDGAVFVGDGAGVTATRKFRNVAASNHKVSVIYDLPSFDPFIARGTRIYGHAAQPFDGRAHRRAGVRARVQSTLAT